MNAKQIEVHNYFKAMHKEALILYHIPGQYMVLGEDVSRAQESIVNIQVIGEGVAVIPDDIGLLSVLCSDGTEVHIVQYKNDNGILDLPDICRLKKEKEMDY